MSLRRCLVPAVGLLTIATLGASAETGTMAGPAMGVAAYKTSLSSLPTVQSGPAPGPDILYAAPGVSPQLENTGVWTAPPILVSGASAYRNGEFLYQDFLYDDLGAQSLYTYPTDPKYAGNAADIVEVRLKPETTATFVRITYNAMLDPSLVAATIALGSSTTAFAMPHGANTNSPGQVFVTVHGATADAVSAATGASLDGTGLSVTPDLTRRQVQVEIPYSIFDPRGSTAVRIALAAGLWNATNNQYLVPQASADATHPGGGASPTASAFFNVAFRYNEPLGGSTTAFMRDSEQGTALGNGDISSLHATVDFTRLAAGTSDDMLNQPQGVPTTGDIDRIFASHFETQQGRGNAVSLQPENCTSACAPTYAGRLQEYSIRVPTTSAPAAGYPLTLELHASGGTENQYQGTLGEQELGTRDGGSIVLTPEARGPGYFYYGQAGADVFEAWADVARNYALNWYDTAITGGSMGGYGTYKLVAQFPDLFAAAAPVAPCPSAGVDYVPYTAAPGGEASAIVHLTASFRHVPTLSSQSAHDEFCTYAGPDGTEQIFQNVDAMNVTYKARTFLVAEHAYVGDLLAYFAQPLVDYMSGRNLDLDPLHVSFAVDGEMSEPALGMASDHAYWLSGVQPASGVTPPIGTIAAVSQGFGIADPAPVATQSGTGFDPGVAYYPYIYQEKVVGSGPAAPAVDTISIVATDVAAVTIDPVRAHVDCNAVIHVSDNVPLTVTLTGCSGPVNVQTG